jgi:hypothetical protein
MGAAEVRMREPAVWSRHAAATCVSLAMVFAAGTALGRTGTPPAYATPVARAEAASALPSLAGRWELNAQLSDAPRGAPGENGGGDPRGGRGDGGGGGH